MAIYHMDVKTFGRASGGRVTRAAAYRAGERIRDERTREVYNHTDRDDVAHKEIMLPAEFAVNPELDWARDRSILWNAAEHTNRRNARLAREVLVILPPELTPQQRIQLVRRFSQELADRFRCAVDTTIHLPRPGADERHHHAHLLMTTREVTPEGLGRRTTLELSGMERYTRRLGSYKDEFVSVRERWAQLNNEALRDAGLEARVDHRGYKARGISAEAVPKIPQKVYYMERNRGTGTQAGDAIRAMHRERVEARQKGPDELARVLQKQKEERRQQAIERARQKALEPKKRSWSSLTRDELNARRRELYSINRERILQRARERNQANPERRREQHRAYRQRKAEELRRKSLELNAEQATEPAKQRSTTRAITPEEAIRNWRAYRDKQPHTPTAEESAKNWLEYRKSHGTGPTAEESVKNWLAFREGERQKEMDHSHGEAAGFTRGPGAVGSSDAHDDEDEEKRRKGRSRDNDYGLE